MNNLALFQQDVPEFLKNAKPDAMTRALAGSSGNKRISIRGSVFRMIVGGEEVSKSDNRSLRVVIVNGAPNVARQFYGAAYNSESVTTPDCWSNDGAKPSSQVTSPVHPTCNECPNNIKGSGQGTSRACRFLRRLAVQIIGDPTQDVYQLIIPSRSLWADADNDNMPFQQYVKMLAGNGRSINTVVTEISFDTDSATPKLFFKAVAHVTEEQYNTAVIAGESEEAKRAITFTVAQTDGVVKKIAPPVKALAKVQLSLAGDDDGDGEPEPKRRDSKKSTVPGTGVKPDLTKIMDEWK